MGCTNSVEADGPHSSASHNSPTRAAPQWTPERRAALSARMKEQNRLRRGKCKPRGLKALRAIYAPEQSRIVLIGDQWVLIPADKARVAIPTS